MFFVLIFLLLSFHRCNCNEENILDDDDELNPFTSLIKRRQVKKVTDEEYLTNLLAHTHLIKILRNKLILHKNDKKNGLPFEVHLTMSVSKVIIDDIEAYYLNTSNWAIINEHFLLNLKNVEKHVDLITNYKEKLPWFKESYFTLCAFISVLFIGRWRFSAGFILLLAWGMWFEYESMERDEELRQQYVANKKQSPHCENHEETTWEYFTSWVHKRDDDECYRYYKAIHSKLQKGQNPIYVLTEVISRVCVIVMRPIGEVIGQIYKGLNQFMPFYFALITLFTMPLMIILLILGILYVCRKVPAQSVPTSIAYVQITPQVLAPFQISPPITVPLQNDLPMISHTQDVPDIKDPISPITIQSRIQL